MMPLRKLSLIAVLLCVSVFSVLTNANKLSEGQEREEDYESRPVPACLLSSDGLVVANLSLRNDSLPPFSLSIPLDTFNCNPSYRAKGVPILKLFEAGCVLQCETDYDNRSRPTLESGDGSISESSTQHRFLVVTYDVSSNNPSKFMSSLRTKIEAVSLQLSGHNQWVDRFNIPSRYGTIHVRLALSGGKHYTTSLTTPLLTAVNLERKQALFQFDEFTEDLSAIETSISGLRITGIVLFVIALVGALVILLWIIYQWQGERMINHLKKTLTPTNEARASGLDDQRCMQTYNSTSHLDLPLVGLLSEFPSPASSRGYSGDSEAPGECLPTKKRKNNHVGSKFKRHQHRQPNAVTSNYCSSFSGSPSPLVCRFSRKSAPVFIPTIISNGWISMQSLDHYLSAETSVQSLPQMSETEPSDHDEEGQIQAAQPVSTTRLQTIGDLSSSASSLSSGSVREEPQGALSQQNLYEFPPSLQSGNLPSIAFSTRLPILAVSDSNISSSGIEPVDEEGLTPLARSVEDIPERVNVANGRSRPSYAGFSSSGSERDVPTAVTTIGYPTSPLMCSDLDDESERPA